MKTIRKIGVIALCMGLIASVLVGCSKNQVPKLGTPTGLSVNQTAKTLSWTAVPNAASYSVQVNSMTPAIGITTTQYSLESLTEPGTYSIRVRAMSANEENYLHSDWSAPYQYTIAEPDAPAFIAKNKLDFYYFDIDDQSDAKIVRSEDVTETGNAINVAVDSGVNCVEMSLNKFFTANENVLGKDFTFTRSDVTETGYAYEQVGPGQEDNANNLWRRVGTENEPKKKADLPAGPKLYVMSPTEVGRASVYMFADKNDALVPFSPTEKSFLFTLNGHNGSTFKIDVRIKGAEAPVAEPTYIPSSKLAFYYFNVDDMNTAKELAASNITTAENIIKAKVGVDVAAVEISLSEYFAENTGILGANFTFTRSDMTETGYAYEQVGPGQEDNANNLWRRVGTEDEGLKKAELPAGPKMYVMSPEEVGRTSVYVFADNTDKTTIFTTEAKRFEFTLHGQDGKQYIMDIEVESTDAGEDVNPSLAKMTIANPTVATVSQTTAKTTSKTAVKTTKTAKKK